MMMAEADMIAPDTPRKRKPTLKVAGLQHRPGDAPRQNGVKSPASAKSSTKGQNLDSQSQDDQNQSLQLKPTAPSAIMHYASTFTIQRGDWVVRLRDDDPASMPTRDKSDIWDGPFQVLDAPTDTDHATVQLKFPDGSKGNRRTDISRLRPVHPVPQMSSRGIFHPAKGVSIYVDKIDFKPKGKKSNMTFIVDRLRGRRDDGASVKYLVHWLGWPSEDDTWEPADSLPALVVEEYELAINPAAAKEAAMKRKAEEALERKKNLPEDYISPQKRRRMERAHILPRDPVDGIVDGKRKTRNSGFIDDLGFGSQEDARSETQSPSKKATSKEAVNGEHTGWN